MSRQEHPFLPEELMAYADGELPADQAALAAKHLETCIPCRQHLANMNRLSHEMAAWQVDEPTAGLTSAVLSEAKRRGQANGAKGSRLTWWGGRRMWAYGIAGGFAALLVATATMMIPSLPRAGEMDDAMTAVAPRGGIINRAEYPNEVRDNFEEGEGTLGRLERNEAPVEAPKTAPPPGTPPTAEVAGTILMPEIVEMPQTNQQPPMQSSNRPGTPEPTGPMIIRTVHLTLITKEFDKARSAIDTIVRSASGYVEQLQVRGEIGTGRGLSVTLRVPVDKLDSSLTELRKLGHVQNESQNSADVSSQYVDLEARLKNARNTEQRFLTLLRERTGNLKDVVEAEREIARVREEIERMDAQIKNLSKRVALATIQVDLQEEFRANLESKLPTTGTRISNAAVDGYKRAAETVIGFVMVILMYGPTLLMLAAATVIISLIIWRFMKHRAVKQA